MPPTAWEDEIIHVARNLACDDTLDVAACLRINDARFDDVAVSSLAWHRFVSCVSQYFARLANHSWQVQWYRPLELITRQHSTTTSPDFIRFAAELTDTLKTDDARVAHWARERARVHTVRLFLPRVSPPEFERLKLALMTWVPARNVIPEPQFQTTTATPTVVEIESSDDLLSEYIGEQRQPEQDTTDTVNAAPAVPTTTMYDSPQEYHEMGQTFNLNDDASSHRTLYQYWVWNEDTDEVLDHANLIVAGDTEQEATANLKVAVKQRLLEKNLGGRIRFHVKKIETFTKTPPDQTVSVEAMLNKLRTVMTGG